MAHVEFTPHLRRHVCCPAGEYRGTTVRAVLDAVLEQCPSLRGYLLDDQNGLRPHVAVFIDNQIIADRVRLSDSVRPDSEIFFMQALSGG